MIELSPKQIEMISDYIFYERKIESNLPYDDIVCASGDYSEEQVVNKLIELRNNGLLKDSTNITITKSHTAKDPEKKGNERNSLEIIIGLLKENNFNNKIIIPESINSDKLLAELSNLYQQKTMNRILIMTKAFTERRQFITASKLNLPIEKMEWYGLVDGRKIDRNNWYKSADGQFQVLKEFISIGDLEIIKELDLTDTIYELCEAIANDTVQYNKYKDLVDNILYQIVSKTTKAR